MGSQKGITMIGLLFSFLIMIVYFAFLPAISALINTVVPQVDQTTGFMISLFPVFMFVIIIIGIQYYGSPNAESVG